MCSWHKCVIQVWGVKNVMTGYIQKKMKTDK